MRLLRPGNSGAREGVFEIEKFTVDVTKSPVPRFDLLNFDHYLHIGVQFSRGCPFTCEFCDIIELYGRVPRAKTNAQTELWAFRRSTEPLALLRAYAGRPPIGGTWRNAAFTSSEAEAGSGSGSLRRLR